MLPTCKNTRPRNTAAGGAVARRNLALTEKYPPYPGVVVELSSPLDPRARGTTLASHDSTRRKEADRGGVARPLSDVLCTQHRRSESGIYARGRDVSSEARAWHSSALYIPRSYIPESTGPQEHFLTFSDTLPAPLSRSRSTAVAIIHR